MKFGRWKLVNLDVYFTEFCSSGCAQSEVNFGLDNGLAPNRWQAIIETLDDPV